MQLGASVAVNGVVFGFVVNAEGGGGAGGREVVDGNPGEDFVRGPEVVVCPVVQFFVYPGEQSYGAVGESVAQCLRLGALLGAVATALAQEPACASDAVLFAGVVGGEGVLEGEKGGGGDGRFGAADEVYVGGFDVVGVEETHGARDHHAPVSALGYCEKC